MLKIDTWIFGGLGVNTMVNRDYSKSKKLHLTARFLIIAFMMILLSGIYTYEFRAFENADAIGGWRGQDSYKVPIAWCAVNGSQAADNPNIPNPWGGSDTTTDDVLLRRHERATDNIFINATGITFRSAINHALYTSLNFPKISDPDVTVGLPGNLTLEDYLGMEYMRMKNACTRAWVNLTANGAVNGIITINIRRFVDQNGIVKPELIGSSYCTDGPPRDGVCDLPYIGDVLVIDNFYTAPGATGGSNNDPYDQNLGHELAHALGLGHKPKPDPIALMNIAQVKNGPGGTVSNIGLNSTEITTLRSNAPNMPGAKTYPDNKILKGSIVQSIRVDDIQENKSENKSLLTYEDISSVKVLLNKKSNAVYFIQELFGFIPETIKSDSQTNIEYWTLVDSDNNTKTGGNETLLQSIGTPSTKNFEGSDLVFRAHLSGNNNLTQSANVTGTGWIFTEENQSMTLLPSNYSAIGIQTAVLELHHNETTQLSETDGSPIYDTVTTVLNNTGNLIQLNKPFSIQALVVSSNGTILDSLEDDNQIKDTRTSLVLTDPIFPQCSVDDATEIGKNTTIHVSGLLPNNNVHALLGPRAVGNGTTDASGNSTIQFTVPYDTTLGLHSITVVSDKTALTADCEIDIRDLT